MSRSTNLDDDDDDEPPGKGKLKLDFLSIDDYGSTKSSPQKNSNNNPHLESLDEKIQSPNSTEITRIVNGFRERVLKQFQKDFKKSHYGEELTRLTNSHTNTRTLYKNTYSGGGNDDKTITLLQESPSTIYHNGICFTWGFRLEVDVSHVLSDEQLLVQKPNFQRHGYFTRSHVGPEFTNVALRTTDLVRVTRVEVAGYNKETPFDYLKGKMFTEAVSELHSYHVRETNKAIEPEKNGPEMTRKYFNPRK